MKRANAVLFSLLIIVSSLAGCIGGEDFDSSDLEQQIADLEKNQELMNQTIIAQQSENDELRASMEMMNQTILAMNQTLIEQSSINAELQQAMEGMNTTIAGLISEIVWANDTANWANITLRLPYMDLFLSLIHI